MLLVLKTAVALVAVSDGGACVNRILSVLVLLLLVLTVLSAGRGGCGAIDAADADNDDVLDSAVSAAAGAGVGVVTPDGGHSAMDAASVAAGAGVGVGSGAGATVGTGAGMDVGSGDAGSVLVAADGFHKWSLVIDTNGATCGGRMGLLSPISVGVGVL